jgi:hypothetical protein
MQAAQTIARVRGSLRKCGDLRLLLVYWQCRLIAEPISPIRLSTAISSD